MFESLFNQALSREARLALDVAQREATTLGNAQVEEVHVLLALMQGPLHDLLVKYGALPDKIREFVRQGQANTPPFGPRPAPFGFSVQRLVGQAAMLAKTFAHDQITIKHLFKALMSTPFSGDSVKVTMLRCGFDVRTLEIKADIMLKLFNPEVASYLEAERSALPDEAPFVGEAISYPRIDEGRNFFTLEMQALVAAAHARAEVDLLEKVGVEHLLLALASSEWTAADVARAVLQRIDVSDRIDRLHPPTPSGFLSSHPMSECFFERDAILALTNAWKEASAGYRDAVGPEHLMLGILAGAPSINLLKGVEDGHLEILRRDLRAQVNCDGATSPVAKKIDFGGEEESPNEVVIVTSRLIEALKFAKEHAAADNRLYADAPHVVLGLITEALRSEVEFVKNRENKLGEIQRLLGNKKGLPTDDDLSQGDIRFAASVWHILRLAKSEAKRTRVDKVDLNHLAIAVLSSNKDLAAELTECSGISLSALQTRLEQCIYWQHHQRLDSGVGIELRKAILDELIVVTQKRQTNKATSREYLERALSSRSNMVFGYAVLEARRLNQSQISIENILAGLIHESFGVTFDVFTLMNIDITAARDELAWMSIHASDRTAARRDLSYNGWLLLEKSLVIAQRWHGKEIEPEHILLAIADEHKGIAALACEALSIDGDELRLELCRRMIEARMANEPGST